MAVAAVELRHDGYFRSMQHIEQGAEWLRNACPVMRTLIDTHGIYRPTAPRHPFTALVRTITGQQLSVKAAATIYGRLEVRANGRIQPDVLAALTEEEFRACGISRQKYGYIRSLCQHFTDAPEVFEQLPNLSDQEVIDALVQIKGIGTWSAQMFLMFTLHRPDVFAPDDVGLQNAMKKLYAWPEPPSKQALIEKAETWRPWRTLACWYLWQSLDNEP